MTYARHHQRRKPAPVFGNFHPEPLKAYIKSPRFMIWVADLLTDVVALCFLTDTVILNSLSQECFESCPLTVPPRSDNGTWKYAECRDTPNENVTAEAWERERPCDCRKYCQDELWSQFWVWLMIHFALTLGLNAIRLIRLGLTRPPDPSSNLGSTKQAGPSPSPRGASRRGDSSSGLIDGIAIDGGGRFATVLGACEGTVHCFYFATMYILLDVHDWKDENVLVLVMCLIGVSTLMDLVIALPHLARFMYLMICFWVCCEDEHSDIRGLDAENMLAHHHHHYDKKGYVTTVATQAIPHGKSGVMMSDLTKPSKQANLSGYHSDSGMVGMHPKQQYAVDAVTRHQPKQEYQNISPRARSASLDRIRNHQNGGLQGGIMTPTAFASLPQVSPRHRRRLTGGGTGGGRGIAPRYSGRHTTPTPEERSARNTPEDHSELEARKRGQFSPKKRTDRRNDGRSNEPHEVTVL